MKVVNNNVEREEPVVNSRYSLCRYHTKKFCQIILEMNNDPDKMYNSKKPLSIAVEKNFTRNPSKIIQTAHRREQEAEDPSGPATALLNTVCIV